MKTKRKNDETKQVWGQATAIGIAMGVAIGGPTMDIPLMVGIAAAMTITFSHVFRHAKIKDKQKNHLSDTTSPDKE